MMNWTDFLNYLKSLINHIINTAVFIIILQSGLFAQQDSTVPQRPGTVEENISDTAFVMTKSPWKAVLFSAVVPGAGQIYNESYWKAPLVWGIAAWLIYNWDFNNDNYKEYKNLLIDNPGIDNYRTIRDFYRDQRDLFSIYLVLTYLLNLVDAYVDAHLFDFNVEENYFTRQPMLGIKINLK